MTDIEIQFTFQSQETDSQVFCIQISFDNLNKIVRIGRGVKMTPLNEW